MAGDLRRHGLHVGKIRRAVVAGRRAHGDKNDERVFDRRRDLGSEAEPSLPKVAVDHLFEAQLVNRNPAVFEGVDPGAVFVDAGDPQAEFGKTGPGHQPHVTRSDHTNIHERLIAFSGVFRATIAKL